MVEEASLKIESFKETPEILKVINENEEEYPVKMATNDIKTIEAIKTSRELYNMFASEPKRTVEKIKSKLNIK